MKTVTFTEAEVEMILEDVGSTRVYFDMDLIKNRNLDPDDREEAIHKVHTAESIIKKLGGE